MRVRIEPTEEGATVTVRLLPRSSRPGVGGVREGALELRVGAPPVEGRANEAARRLLAKLTGLPRSAVRLVTGARSRQKVFRLEGIAPDELRRRLETLVKRP
jgi:uncharacterized protein (TIGR00251 family)